MEERRICRFQTFIRQGATIERNVIPIINTCIAGMDKAADSIVSTEVNMLTIHYISCRRLRDRTVMPIFAKNESMFLFWFAW